MLARLHFHTFLRPLKAVDTLDFQPFYPRKQLGLCLTYDRLWPGFLHELCYRIQLRYAQAQCEYNMFSTRLDCAIMKEF